MSRNDADKFMRALRRATRGNGVRETFDTFASSLAYFLAAGSGNDCKWLAERAESALSALTGDAAARILELHALVIDLLEANPDQDLLGVSYTLLGLGDARKGQFFTPYEVCKLSAQLADAGARLSEDVERMGYVTCADPAAGCGAMLLAMATLMRERGINYQEAAYFRAQELDTLTALVCYAQMSLLGMAGSVAIGNTLTEDVRHVLYTPMATLKEVWVWRRVLWRLEALESGGLADEDRGGV